MKTIYHGRGGWDYERAEAEKLFTIGDEYEIVDANVGSSKTYLTLKGVQGVYNSVLFDVDIGKLIEKFGTTYTLSMGIYNEKETTP